MLKYNSTLKFLQVLFLFSIGAYSQSTNNTTRQNLLWTRYYNQITINEKWSVHSELEARIFSTPLTENLNLFRIQGRYRPTNNIETGVGMAYFSVATQNPELISNFKTPEYRLQQDVIWKHFIFHTILSQRLQIEERFVENTNNETVLPGSVVTFRLRYRLQAEFPIWQNKSKFIKAILFDEVHFNFGKTIINNTFDQNRVYAGIQYGINSNFALELGILNSYQKRASGIDYYDRDVIRVSLFHKIKLHKKV